METTTSPTTHSIEHHLPHNLLVNIVDGAFFGFAIGFASFGTILPLFVDRLTDSALLIGLVPALHNLGWQLPQLFTSQRVARLPRFKGMVLLNTLQERLPFLLLAGVAGALLMGWLNSTTALWITLLLLAWQGLGGGITAVAWQSMIGKIIPARRRGAFLGMQAGAANLLLGFSAVLAGWLLETYPNETGFMYTFLLAAFFMGVSFFFLAQTREELHQPDTTTHHQSLWTAAKTILRRDAPFRRFLLIRNLTQFGLMGTNFYIIYLSRTFEASPLLLGWMTSVLSGSQILINPLMGWLGDKYSHRTALLIGGSAAFGSALIAQLAPTAEWFFLVFLLLAVANVAAWVIAIALTLEFGTLSERPIYIGLANTLTAPSTILAPVLGGWLADTCGFSATFFAAIVFSLLTLPLLWSLPKSK